MSSVASTPRYFALPIALRFGATVSAQMPAPSVHLSFGVDTMPPMVRDVARLTTAYLLRPDTSARSRGLLRDQRTDCASHLSEVGDRGTSPLHDAQGEPAALLARLPQFVEDISIDVNAWWRAEAVATTKR